jgi:hypothetical protein
MNGATPLLPLYAFTAWTGITLPFIFRLSQTSGTDYPVTLCYIPQERNPQPHCCEDVEIHTINSLFVQESLILH